MAVKFKQNHTIGALYVAGDVAVFDKEIEKKLIEREIAEAVKPSPAEKPAD